MRPSNERPAPAATVEQLTGDRALIALNAIAGVAALGGAWYALSGAPDVPTNCCSARAFSDDTVPGLIVGAVYAPTSLAAATALRRRHPRAADIALGAGAVPVGWIAAQVAVIGVLRFLRRVMLGVGLLDLVLAGRRRRR